MPLPVRNLEHATRARMTCELTSGSNSAAPHPYPYSEAEDFALTQRPTPRWVRYSETALERAIPYLRPSPEKVPVGRQH